MKLYTKITIVLVVIIGVAIYFFVDIRKDYKVRLNDVNLVRQESRMNTTNWLIDCFGTYDFNLHNQLNTMVPSEWSNKKRRFFLNHFFRDSLNKSGHILQYVPLYNRKNNKKEAFLLISAGIDGKLNVKYTVGDTIYEDEYLEKFDFYNINEYIENKSMEFNIIDYFFCKKDYLVKYINCIENIRIGPMTMEHYNYKMIPPVNKLPLSIVAKYERDSIDDYNRLIVLKSWMDGYNAFCKMHNPIKEKFKVGDSIMISGYLERIDENRNFHLTHCNLFNNTNNQKLSEIIKLSTLRKRELENRNKILLSK